MGGANDPPLDGTGGAIDPSSDGTGGAIDPPDWPVLSVPRGTMEPGPEATPAGQLMVILNVLVVFLMSWKLFENRRL